MVVENKYHRILEKLNLISPDLFKGEQVLMHEIVLKLSNHRVTIDNEKLQMKNLYDTIKLAVKEIDITLVQHIEALETKNLKELLALEKKMLRAEKRKYADQKNQLVKIFSVLFPQGNLQERTENFMMYYDRWGSSFFEMLYDNSLTLEQEFCLIDEEEVFPDPSGRG